MGVNEGDGQAKVYVLVSRRYDGDLWGPIFGSREVAESARAKLDEDDGWYIAECEVIFK